MIDRQTVIELALAVIVAVLILLIGPGLAIVLFAALVVLAVSFVRARLRGRRHQPRPSARGTRRSRG